MLKRRINFISATAITLALVACSNHRAGDNVVHFERFEQLIFDTPTDQLGARLQTEQSRFSTTLLNIQPSDAQYMAMLSGFVTDPVVRDIYHTTDSLYHDLSDIEARVGSALNKATKLMPTLDYRHFYTLVTADFDDYRNRVFCDDHSLAISIDKYALPYLERYNHFGVPMYIVNLCTRDHIVADCMAAIARANIELPDADMTLLDYMVAEGKTLYFVSQAMPSTPDTIVARYTAEQMEWMIKNEHNVWAYFVQNQLLYSIDRSQFHNFIDDAPKTNAFGDGSAPRTAAYIGWQIVNQYMKRTHASMSELFAYTNSQSILQKSNYRP
ncbi:MAG: hypothetical protein K5650_02040 [Bacteroidales bacterium]|nr:hypothetical protein [Bacteroidales bacterium]